MPTDFSAAGPPSEELGFEGARDVRILVVDDESANVRLIERLLRRAGYTSIHTLTDSRQAMELVEELQPDLVLLDLQMPHITGLEILAELSGRTAGEDLLPVLVLTADITQKTRYQALSLGASDFVTKPFDMLEVLLRVRNLIRIRLLNTRLQREQSLLEARVSERTQELEQAQFEVLRRLAQAAEFRDDDTGQHTYRVGTLSKLLAEEMGMPADWVADLAHAAPLHDVGKIGIADVILRKPGRLTDAEYEIMKTHTTIGANLLAGGRSRAVLLAEEIARCHHERWDGSGYPAGLIDDDIPLSARIVALADFFDALAHDRPYRRAWPMSEITAEIKRRSGHHFDPGIVTAFEAIRPRISRYTGIDGADE